MAAIRNLHSQLVRIAAAPTLHAHPVTVLVLFPEHYHATIMMQRAKWAEDGWEDGPRQISKADITQFFEDQRTRISQRLARKARATEPSQAAGENISTSSEGGASGVDPRIEPDAAASTQPVPHAGPRALDSTGASAADAQSIIHASATSATLSSSAPAARAGSGAAAATDAASARSMSAGTGSGTAANHVLVSSPAPSPGPPIAPPLPPLPLARLTDVTPELLPFPAARALLAHWRSLASAAGQHPNAGLRGTDDDEAGSTRTAVADNFADYLADSGAMREQRRSHGGASDETQTPRTDSVSMGMLSDSVGRGTGHRATAAASSMHHRRSGHALQVDAAGSNSLTAGGPLSADSAVEHPTPGFAPSAAWAAATATFGSFTNPAATSGRGGTGGQPPGARSPRTASVASADMSVDDDASAAAGGTPFRAREAAARVPAAVSGRGRHAAADRPQASPPTSGSTPRHRMLASVATTGTPSSYVGSLSGDLDSILSNLAARREHRAAAATGGRATVPLSSGASVGSNASGAGASSRHPLASRDGHLQNSSTNSLHSQLGPSSSLPRAAGPAGALQAAALRPLPPVASPPPAPPPLPPQPQQKKRDFLSRIKQPEAADVADLIKSFLNNFSSLNIPELYASAPDPDAMDYDDEPESNPQAQHALAGDRQQQSTGAAPQGEGARDSRNNSSAGDRAPAAAAATAAAAPISSTASSTAASSRGASFDQAGAAPPIAPAAAVPAPSVPKHRLMMQQAAAAASAAAGGGAPSSASNASSIVGNRPAPAAAASPAPADKAPAAAPSVAASTPAAATPPPKELKSTPSGRNVRRQRPTRTPGSPPGSAGAKPEPGPSERVRAFVTRAEETLRAHPLWRGDTVEEWEETVDALEKFIMCKLHDRVFAAHPACARRDAALAKRLQGLSFVTFRNLEIADPQPHFAAAWKLAQAALRQLERFKSPGDKLACIMNACRIISTILTTEADERGKGEKGVGADEFVPGIIYTVIRACPKRLYSNLRYIGEYRNPSKLMSEQGYFYTNILSAVSFAKKAKPEQLCMTREEFEAGMKIAMAEGREMANANLGRAVVTEETARRMGRFTQGDGPSAVVDGEFTLVEPEELDWDALLDRWRRSAVGNGLGAGLEAADEDDEGAKHADQVVRGFRASVLHLPEGGGASSHAVAGALRPVAEHEAEFAPAPVSASAGSAPGSSRGSGAQADADSGSNAAASEADGGTGAFASVLHASLHRIAASIAAASPDDVQTTQCTPPQVEEQAEASPSPSASMDTPVALLPPLSVKHVEHVDVDAVIDGILGPCFASRFAARHGGAAPSTARQATSGRPAPPSRLHLPLGGHGDVAAALRGGGPARRSVSVLLDEYAAMSRMILQRADD